MSASSEHRKLAAIMFTDMVGYSALVEHNETRALQLLEEHRRLLRSIFPKHEGSEIKTLGDGFLVEFSSALAAVQCGIEIQEAIAKRNSANSSQGNFQVRIGIHAGDVVRRADDVIGDGVNIAARIVPLAGACGICVSRQVFDQVESRLVNPLKRMGQVKLKNMIRPLEVYWVGYEGAPTDLPDLAQTDHVSSTQKSIAVLPFVNMSSDPENEYLSDGLTEDLIMAFSRLKGLRVPARTSSFAFKGKNEDICRIGHQLNVTKILEGSVRKVGDRLRITAQLINVADGDHLWANTFDRQMQEVFAIQDEITREIVNALEMQLVDAGDQPLAKHGTYNTDAYQLYLQARYHFYKFTGEGFRRCLECCKKALEIEPNYALAYAALSLSYQTGWFYGFLSFEEKLAAIGPHDLFAEKAVELDPNLAETQTVLGIVKCWNLRDWPGGEECFKRAIELNPNYVTAREHYGGLLACLRRTDEALAQARLALQIDPLSLMINLHVGVVYWILHRYDLLLEQARRLFELESNFFGTYWLFGWGHWCQGMRDAAVTDLRRALTLGGGPIQLADLGCFLGLLGRKAEAQQVLEDLNELGKQRYVQPAYRGFVHASLGNYDEAFACFAEGMQHENLSVAFIGEYCISAGLDELRADPRFPALLKKIGLEESIRDEVTGSGAAETVVKKQLNGSPTPVSESPKKCPRCGAVIPSNQRSCINCLLHEGLEAKGEASREVFESVLAKANVIDTHWRLGHYEILEEIGRGGMGVIYRARQQHSRRIVAVKRVLAHQVNSHETLIRFRREAEAVASLDHPNILPIYEVSESEEDLPYFSMKYATGGSLRAAAPGLRTNPRDCVRLTAKIARAIAYAHGKGILHRDLQPGNILLDENGEPMVSDFGLAKWLDQGSDLTRTLETLGTPGYIAPEQAECRADKLTSAADTYSLGAILFYLLSGRPPFVGSNVLHVIHQAVATPAPRLRSLVPSLDRDLETIVDRCLESDPNARYQSAGALADDLEHWLRHEPIQARRSGVFTRVGKWVRRNRTTTMLIAALVVLAAAIVGMMVLKNESPHALASLPAGIAVLPLQNLSEEKENAYFADGIQDELLTNLSKIRDLKVISRTSVMQYKSGITRNLKEIAQQLGISNLVEGSVRRSGNRVRVSVQLIDANTDRHIWAQNYDRTLADSLSLQGDLATEIAAALGGTLSPQEKARVQAKPTKNTTAYDAYLRGRAFAARSYQKSYEDNAIKSYQEAVTLDPSFALAWARLSIAVGNDPWNPSPERLAEVKDAADHARALDPDLPETHLALGYYRYGQRDYIGALGEFQQAEQGLPNNAEVIEAIALVQRRLGHWEEAITGLRRTIEVDPRYHDAYENLAGTYRWLRRFPEALATVDQLLAWEPTDPIALGRKAAAFWAMGDLQSVEPLLTNPGFDPYDRGVQALFQRRYAAAIQIFSAAPSLNLAPSPSTSERELFLGLSQQRVGDVAAARATYQKAAQDFQHQLEKVVPDSWAEAWLRTCLGRAHAGLGDAASAIAEGQKAMAIDPASKNPVDGPVREEKMANIYALLGDADHAIAILGRLLQITYAGAITPALLRLDPVWDQIRNDPRFQELAEERKPIPEKGIAVLPFENLSTDPENAFFADGVQDEILNNLAKIAELKVISRTSVMQYKTHTKRNLRQIANELGVAHVVEGSVQRAANRVRVSAQLIDAKNDTHLWANSYDRPLSDVFAIQSEIAKAIAMQLRAKLSPSQSNALAAAPTHDTEAYDLFLKGEYEERQAESTYKGEIYDRAAAFYQQAITRDPSFGLAYARLAYSRLFRHWYVKRMTSTQLEQVNSDIEHALSIAPDSPDAHLALGLFHYWGRHEFDSAVREFDRTIELQPSNSVSREFRAAIYRRRGEWRRALAEFERGIELDPRDVWKSDNLGSAYLLLRRWRDAEHWLKHALALDPHHVGAAYRLHLTYLASTGDIQRARQAWEGIPVQKATTTVGAYEIVIPQMIDDRVYFDVLERNFPRALKEWDVAPANTVDARLVQLKARIGIQVLAGQKGAAKRECEEARNLLEAELAKRQPGDRTSWSETAWIYVCLRRNADALRIAREAAESMPIEKDAILGVNFVLGLAQIEAHAGQSAEAIKILRQLLTIPAGEYVSVARLKIDPVWDPIRNEPDFQKLLSEPEPETIYN